MPAAVIPPPLPPHFMLFKPSSAKRAACPFKLNVAQRQIQRNRHTCLGPRDVAEWWIIPCSLVWGSRVRFFLQNRLPLQIASLSLISMKFLSVI